MSSKGKRTAWPPGLLTEVYSKIVYCPCPRYGGISPTIVGKNCNCCWGWPGLKTPPTFWYEAWRSDLLVRGILCGRIKGRLLCSNSRCIRPAHYNCDVPSAVRYTVVGPEQAKVGLALAQIADGLDYF
jgi:hypothetical protein